MVGVIIGIAGAVTGQIVFYFIQKFLDKWWNSHFPQSNENTIP